MMLLPQLNSSVKQRVRKRERFDVYVIFFFPLVSYRLAIGEEDGPCIIIPSTFHPRSTNSFQVSISGINSDSIRFEEIRNTWITSTFEVLLLSPFVLSFLI